MSQTQFVAYLRVSTNKQGHSGLGLEAQQAAVAAFTGGEIIAEYVEIESGRKADRPQLAAAIAHCRRVGATLVVAKLDRLSRNVAFVSALIESGVEFVAVDNPNANRLTIHILAAVAEEEARAISTRTKAALAAAKARGTKLGTPANLTNAHRVKGAEAMKAKAQRAYAHIITAMAAMRAAGASLQAIADDLNQRGETTQRGSQWSRTQVSRALARA